MSVIASLLVSACLSGSPAPASSTPASSTAVSSTAASVKSASLEPASLAGAPARVTAGVGAFQSTPVGTGFPLRLAVTVTDAEQKPVLGVPVTFTAPARGPSGHFAVIARGPRPRRVRVRTDTCGIAVAPAFIANAQQGGYLVTAAVAHVRPAAFALVNAGPERRP
jgi:hypothetical protein